MIAMRMLQGAGKVCDGVRLDATVLALAPYKPFSFPCRDS
jgi:hypothetical protein